MPRRPLREPIVIPTRPSAPPPAWLMACAGCARLVDRILGALATETDKLCLRCAFRAKAREALRRTTS